MLYFWSLLALHTTKKIPKRQFFKSLNDFKVFQIKNHNLLLSLEAEFSVDSEKSH